jgi:N-acetylglucosamine-6-sulfatase
MISGEKVSKTIRTSLLTLMIGMATLWLAGCNLIRPSAVTPGPAAGTSTAQGGEPSVNATGKPNILFILTDDLDAAEMEYMPNLKALIAGQGETFSNYFVPESLCCPSRATTLRGQYPHNTRILTNDPPTGGFARFFNLGEEKSTVAVWLQNAGYRTVLAGKYLNGYPLKNDPLYIPPGWAEWYSPVKGDPYGEFNYSLNENGKQVAYGHKPEDYGTDVYVGKVLNFIQRNGKDSQPFFIYLAPYAPHAPYTPAPRHANLFPDAKAPRTPNFDETDVSDKPGYIRERSFLTQQQLDQIDEAYRKRLQSLQAVDEGIRSIVDALQANGKLKDTYIFFTSDNGYHLGNHRQVVGKIAPYEEELRVTMSVRGPGVPAGKMLSHLTGNVDLAPTWAELAGAKTPNFVDGRSLVPLLGDNPPQMKMWRQEFPLEYGPDPLAEPGPTETVAPPADQTLEPPDQDQVDSTAMPPETQKKLAIPPFRGIRLATLSYVEYRTGEIEMYDIQNDPYELNNLAPTADPKLLKQLDQRMKQLAICKAASCRAAEDAPFDLPKSLTSPVAWIAGPGSPAGVEYFIPQDGF